MSTSTIEDVRVQQPEPRPGPRPGRESLLLLAFTAVVMTVGLLSLAAAPDAKVDGYGLLTSLPLPYLISISALIVLFLGGLARGRVSAVVLYLQVICLVVLLGFAPVLIEPYARFPTAYIHVGLVDVIQRSGHVINNYDARFSWPGFFAWAAAFTKAAGLSTTSLLRWWPMVAELLYLIPLTALARSFIADPRRRSCVLFVFVIGNWVGQDYFSPQAMNLLLFLCFMAIAVRVFGLGEPTGKLSRFLCRVTRRDSGPLAAATPVPRPQQAAWLLALLAIYAGSVVSHQLTPFFILFAVTAMVLLRTFRLRSLPVTLAVMLSAFILWGAADYWHGHLHELIDGIGNLTQSFNQNVGSRSGQNGDPARPVVLDSRLLMSALVWLAAIVGLWRDRSRRLVAPALMSVVPFLVLGLQSYGGEAILRAQLFALPFAAILAAAALPARIEAGGRTAGSPLPPLRLRAKLTSGVAITVIAAILPTGFMLARYGNESFEAIRPADVAAVRALYTIAPKGAALVSVDDALPWRTVDIEQYRYPRFAPLPLTAKATQDALYALGREKGPLYLIAGEAQWQELRQLNGASQQAVDRAKLMLAKSPLLKRVYHVDHTAIYLYVGSR